MIAEGKNVLLVAPTASGKTEAAFLPIIDALIKTARTSGIKVLYLTPLKALNRDMLDRLQWWCKRLDLRLGVRHGDTSPRERESQAMVPPDILITTPETLQAILTGRIMRQHLAAVKWVIVDEVHELACDKRGSQLALALERLRYLKNAEFQVIGLSATIGSPDKVAKFLVGTERDCEIINVSVSRSMQVEVYYPRADSHDYQLAEELYTYPEVAARLRLMRKLVEQHKSTLIFTNTRSITEILGSRFRVWDLNFLVGVHHGSLSKPSRIKVESDIKEGKLRGIICTSSLELGIDIGRLDFVVQYNSPRQVTRLLQRIGRSGHRIGGIANGAIVVQDSDDALEALAICRSAIAEDLEPADIPQKPLDVLAHQVVGLLLTKRRWSFEEALNLIKKAYPYRDLEEHELVTVLDYMHSRIPRLLWYSAEDKVFLRPNQIKPFYSYYFEHLSMIPEERHSLVIDEEGDNPVGVLDEAFVAEYGKPGNKFVEGGRVWKILHLYGNSIYVKHEDDPTGAIPSWVGEEIPVPYAVSEEVGKLRGYVKTELEKGKGAEEIGRDLVKIYPCREETIIRALDEVVQQEKRGYPIPTDKLITLERWHEYIIIQCSFGLRANRTLAMLLATVISDKIGAPVGVQQDPYRIMLRTESELEPEEVEAIILDLSARNIEKLAMNALSRSRLFKRRFIHVARRFGAISKAASLSDLDLDNLIRSFEDSAVFDEAIRESQDKDVDIHLTAQLLKRLNEGKLKLAVIKGKEVSPVASIVEVIKRGYELIPPERMHKVIIKYVKARLLDESLTFVCTNCWRYVEAQRINDVSDTIRCPECESKQIGALEADEDTVRKEIRKAKNKKLLDDAKSSAELISTYGRAALVTLAGKGLKLEDVIVILDKESEVNEHLIELIIESEKEVLKRRFFRYRKEKK